eukprot:TRINITY_DN8894_c0_g1_i1.p2 TRINITY_DN8894_c0_g1~~TRINITY_DN8894_c0_g1_i1.p2  ORF type:complete len:108 (+),score=39.52 TRINITY_DN8894_c0_g1_i1:141-464(+)
MVRWMGMFLRAESLALAESQRKKSITILLIGPCPSSSSPSLNIFSISLWVVELIRREMEKMVREGEEEEGQGPINSIVIDFFLWDSAKANDSALRNIPIHRTITYFY